MEVPQLPLNCGKNCLSVTRVNSLLQVLLDLALPFRYHAVIGVINDLGSSPLAKLARVRV